MSLMSNIEKYGLGTFCSGIIEYSLRDLQVLEIVGNGGYWVGQGVVVTYFCIKDLSNGNIKSGLFKGVIGASSIANGIYQLSKVVTDANEWQCAIWPKSLEENQGVHFQPCNAFECRSTLSMKFQCVSEEQCYPPSLTPITVMKYIKCTWINEKIGPVGFTNVYEMRKAISS